MVNKKSNTTKKKSNNKTKENSNSTKNSSTSKKKTKDIKNSTKKTVSKTPLNKNNKVKTSKKTAPQRSTKKEIKEIVFDNVSNNSFSEQEIIEKEIIQEITDIKSKKAKLENAKYYKRKNDKKLLIIGVFISALGIFALILTLIANRIIDREFLNDSAILVMTLGSIIIEAFGSFIIINET